MSDFHNLLHPTAAGLYCPPGNFFIDPVAVSDFAVVTHGHGDHARSGHGAVLATRETLGIMEARYGAGHSGATQAATYGETISRNSVAVTLFPAGHILGSAQVRLAWKGMTIIVSGDYKRRRDPTCAAFEPQACDVFVSEATFGLPVFCHPPDEGEIAKLLHSVAQFPERTHLVGAYALGKAQRLIMLLREAGYHDTIYVHGAMQNLNALYESFGVKLGDIAPATTDKKEKLEGRIVIAPPSAIADKWSRRFADPVPAFASGWMRVRARARQKHVELPLILSDHGDWNELTSTIAEIAPQEAWITHGAEEGLLRWAELNGIKARALSLVGYQMEDGEA